MIQAGSPPAIVQPARAEAEETISLAYRDRTGALTRASRVEDVVTRHQLVMRVSVRPRPVTNQNEADCEWSVRSYLQREICFRSMTGLFSCTEPTSTQLAEGSEGKLRLAADLPPDEAVCDTSLLPMTRSRDKLAEELRGRSTAIFNDDLRLRVTPLLTNGGIAVRWRD